MKRKKKIILIISLVGLAVIAIILNFISIEIYSLRYGNPIKRVYFKNVVIRAEVVGSKDKIEKGLAGRKNLADDAGMLFAMPADTIQNFWMKGMQFPIDIIWIENNRVIGCERAVSPDDSRRFSSPGFSSLVLEVNKGFCDRNDVSVNDQIKVQ